MTTVDNDPSVLNPGTGSPQSNPNGDEAQPIDPERLMWALDFTQDDLEANRQGKLSEMQHYKLRVRRRRAILTGLSIIVLFVFVATVLIFMGRQQGSDILMVLGVGVTFGNAAMTGIFGRYWLRINADIQKGEVRIIDGTLERVVKPITQRVVNMIIRVDDFETIVNKEVFECFAHKQTYRIYATPYTGMMLAAEALD